MNHETKVVSHEQRGDQFVVWIECCGTHKHPHTVHLSVANDIGALKSSLEIARKTAAQNHDSVISAISNLDSLVEK